MTDERENWPETPSGEPIDTDALAEGEGGGPYDADGVFEPEDDAAADDEDDPGI
ncbi:hypothetical protein [Leifsonia shinshuensis]|uniref:Uncharacterized protein n=1 Tax=Leifsonia shinshuensis TaxID=150026 RepID=A0A853D1A1_9MICO|nr:hypothetical protein [Leifsonia shinshuensis]NYJ25271.1 hypothetical protein [Leifsonia shinshuensis]